MKYECKENDCIIEIGTDKSEILISVKGESSKTIIRLKNLNQALILFSDSKQREILIDFIKWYVDVKENYKNKKIIQIIDNYIKINS